MRALSIRQPWAELILRGVKTIEYRSRPTRIIGQRFWIYAAKGARTGAAARPRRGGRGVVSDNLAVPTEGPPAWMLELAERLILSEDGQKLPTGVIVGSAVIERVTPGDNIYEWHLAAVERAAHLRKPSGHPQPVWFNPF